MKSRIVLNIGKNKKKIDPCIYGHFAEHIGGVIYDGIWVGKDSKVRNYNGFRAELVDKLKKINPPVIRWPGGCYAETYNWRDGIGENRAVRRGWWYESDGMTEPNTVGTHEFVDFCRMVGAEPYFAMNITSGTPMDAREWIEYCNTENTSSAKEREKNGSRDSFRIKYWGIGNENWGGGGNMRPEYFADLYRIYSVVTYNVDSNTELICGGANASDYDWTRRVLENLSQSHKHMHGYSVHFYCADEGKNQTLEFSDNEWYQQINQAKRIDEIINTHWGIIKSYNMEDCAKLVIDEWGAWHHDRTPFDKKHLYAQQATMREAMVSAVTFNIFNNNCDKVRMANAAQLVNCIHSLFLSCGDKCITTPIYHVFDMYKGHQGGTVIETVVDNKSIEFTDRQKDVCLLDMLSVSASEKEGNITLTAANVSLDEDATVTLDTGNFEIDGDIKMSLLNSNNVHDCNTYENPEKITVGAQVTAENGCIVIPKASIALITFSYR